MDIPASVRKQFLYGPHLMATLSTEMVRVYRYLIVKKFLVCLIFYFNVCFSMEDVFYLHYVGNAHFPSSEPGALRRKEHSEAYAGVLQVDNTRGG